MRQNYMILDGIKYTQGTIFVIKEWDHEERMTFLYHDPEKNFYYFLRPNNAGLDSQTTFPDTRFMKNFVHADQPTEKEQKVLHDVLHKEVLRQRESKKWHATDLDVFLLMILMIVIMAVFPPAAIIILLIAFARKQK